MPAVSVVIPLYNKGPYIVRALCSILNQTVQDFEVIVVDDGSTDDGAEAVRSVEDPRIRLIQQENQGVSAARNRGIEDSQAGMIAFLDADDEWMPAFLETILTLQGKFPGAGAYATAFYTQDKTQTLPMKHKIIPPGPWEGVIPRYFLTSTYCDLVTSSSVCIPKKVFDEVGLFIVGEWWGEDTEMWGRIALDHTIVFSWNYGAIYHFDAGNRANERRASVVEHPFTKTGLQYIQNNLQHIDPVVLQDVREYIEITKLHAAARALKSGDSEFARSLLRNCETRVLAGKKWYIYMVSYLPGGLFYTMRTIKHHLMR